MSRGFNQVTLIGSVGKDPELKYTPSGTEVCNFSVAVNQKRGQDEEVEWFDCVAWKEAAVTLDKYLRQGSRIHITGRMKSRKYKPSWADREIKVWEVNVNEFTLLGDPAARDGERQAAAPAPAARPAARQAAIVDDFDDDADFAPAPQRTSARTGGFYRR